MTPGDDAVRPGQQGQPPYGQPSEPLYASELSSADRACGAGDPLYVLRS